MGLRATHYGRTANPLKWRVFRLNRVTAGILWAPASGQHTRTRLAARLRDWSRALTGHWNLRNPWSLTRNTRRPAPKATPDLSLHPERLLTE